MTVWVWLVGSGETETSGEQVQISAGQDPQDSFLRTHRYVYVRMCVHHACVVYALLPIRRVMAAIGQDRTG